MTPAAIAGVDEAKVTSYIGSLAPSENVQSPSAVMTLPVTTLCTGLDSRLIDLYQRLCWLTYWGIERSRYRGGVVKDGGRVVA